MSTLYVTEPGAQVEREYRHLLVVCQDETRLRVPLADVDHVVLLGQGVGATTPALHALLEAGIPLSLVKYNGELLGRLTPPNGLNLDLRRRQYGKPLLRPAGVPRRPVKPMKNVTADFIFLQHDRNCFVLVNGCLSLTAALSIIGQGIF
mgnify:CR=1 FL=1